MLVKLFTLVAFLIILPAQANEVLEDSLQEPPQAGLQRSPAILGPPTDEPTGENAELYRELDRAFELNAEVVETLDVE